MFGGSSTSLFNSQATPFAGARQIGNAPIGTPSGDLQNGGLYAPYGTAGGNGIYAGNSSGYYTYPGGWGYGGNTMGGGYANNDIGYSGYGPFYGNNGGRGLNTSGLTSQTLASGGLNTAGLNSSGFASSTGLNTSGLNTGQFNYYSPYANGNYTQGYYGTGTPAVPTGPGVGNLGYPNPVTAGAYPSPYSESAPTSTGTNAGPSGNYAPAYYGNAPQAYSYGLGAESVPTGPGVGAFGYPNPATPGMYPAGSYGWY
jgi:hypothetical protein